MSSPQGYDELNVIEPVDAIRHLVAQVFRSGQFNAVEAAGLVVESALICGALTVEVRRIGSWYVIVGDRDWLVEDGKDVSSQAFQRIQSIRGEVNSFRPEILLSAFSEEVFTIAHGQLSIIKGSCQELVSVHPEVRSWGARVTGFRDVE